MKKPYAVGHWEAMGWQYPDEFQKFIEDMKREQLAPNNPSEADG
jgi:phosphopentomutase